MPSADLEQLLATLRVVANERMTCISQDFI